jgi:protein phosphatase
MPFKRRKKNESEILKTVAPPDAEAAGSQQGNPQGTITRLLSYKLGNLQGIGSRQNQEDSFTTANAFDVVKAKEQGLFFAVCDGMGGMKDGKLASETAVSSLRNSFLGFDRSADLSMQLRDGIIKASDEVESLIGGDGGSTAVVGIILDEKLYFASVGDSYFYLFREGKLIRLNAEHNILHDRYLEEIERGNMHPEDAREGKEDAALTSFLGMVGIEQIDLTVRPIPLRDRDVLIACSDGVGGVVTEEEMINALSLSDPTQACADLERSVLAHANPHQDNYTAVVIDCII